MRNSVSLVSHAIVLFSVVLLGLQARAQQAGPSSVPLLISGFDDVLRQANNTSLWAAGKKVMEPDQGYAGMVDLYARMTGGAGGAQPFYVVSSFPIWLESRAVDFLNTQRYPKCEVYLRDWILEWSAEKFKLDRIQKILAENKGRKFIVILDNSQSSLDIAVKLKALHPNELLQVYVRETVRRKLPDSVVPFVTAFDIALNEFKSRRMSEDDLYEVGKASLQDGPGKSLVPDYSYCPSDYNPCADFPLQVRGMCSEISAKISRHCQGRVSKK